MWKLKGIYKGDFKNWKEVGGPDQQIVVVLRDTSSGTYEVWEEKVINKERVNPGALLQASNGAVVQAVSKNKNAIGYIGLGYVNDTVKALSANGIKGTAERMEWDLRRFKEKAGSFAAQGQGGNSGT
jgi:phosphate transport system substrate-binding protein